MSKIKLVLLSRKGRIKDTLTELFTSDFDVININTDVPCLSSTLSDSSNVITEADVCVVNLSHISENSGAIFHQIKKDITDKPLIVFHHYHQRAFAEAFIQMGANAYLPTNLQNDELDMAIEKVLTGDIYISPSVQ